MTPCCQLILCVVWNLSLVDDRATLSSRRGGTPTCPGEFFFWTHFREVHLRMRSVNCHGNVQMQRDAVLAALDRVCMYVLCVRAAQVRF